MRQLFFALIATLSLCQVARATDTVIVRQFPQFSGVPNLLFCVSPDEQWVAAGWNHTTQSDSSGIWVTSTDGAQLFFVISFADLGDTPTAIGWSGSEILHVLAGIGGVWSLVEITNFLPPATAIEAPTFHAASGKKLVVSPNPIIASSIIQYSVDVEGDVTLAIYDVEGRSIARLIDNVHHMPGSYEARIEKDLSAGIYFVEMFASQQVTAKKVVVLH